MGLSLLCALSLATCAALRCALYTNTKPFAARLAVRDENRAAFQVPRLLESGGYRK